MKGSTVAINVLESEDGSEHTVVSFDDASKQLCIDRRASGRSDFADGFAAVHCAPLQLYREGEVELLVVVDSSSVEAFGEGGKAAVTDLVYPNADSVRVSLSLPKTAKSEAESLKIYKLNSAYESDLAFVYPHQKRN